jgi:2-phospho-L-lactate guanylyltransferase
MSDAAGALPVHPGRNGPVAILVAVRRPEQAKSRLAGALAPALRRDLVRAMLDDVLAAARAAHDGPLFIVTPDEGYGAIAARHGAALIPDDGDGFNAAVCASLAGDALATARAVLVLPADLPQLRADDVAAVLAALDGAPVVLVPSADGGTTALGLRPPDGLAPAFGPGSAEAHRAGARAAGLPVHELRPPSLAADIDTPADLIAVADRVGPATRAVLPRLPEAWRAPEGAR